MEDVEQQRKQDSDSGVGSDNGDKRLSATEVLRVCVFHGACVCLIMARCCVSVCFLHRIYLPCSLG